MTRFYSRNQVNRLFDTLKHTCTKDDVQSLGNDLVISTYCLCQNYQTRVVLLGISVLSFCGIKGTMLILRFYDRFECPESTLTCHWKILSGYLCIVQTIFLNIVEYFVSCKFAKPCIILQLRGRSVLVHCLCVTLMQLVDCLLVTLIQLGDCLLVVLIQLVDRFQVELVQQVDCLLVALVQLVDGL